MSHQLTVLLKYQGHAMLEGASTGGGGGAAVLLNLHLSNQGQI